MPRNEILFLHVKLKGLQEALNYKEATASILEELNNVYKPKTIIIPAYTYSFTKSGIYDKVRSASETGRFGEECRLLLGPGKRTLNPVFNITETVRMFSGDENVNIRSAFGGQSMFDLLAKTGYVMVNVNLEELRPAHLHYIECKLKVPYRFNKVFEGKIFEDGRLLEEVKYDFFVRNFEMDSVWRREKIEDFLRNNGALHDYSTANIRLQWMHSTEMDKVLVPAMISDPLFLVKD